SYSELMAQFPDLASKVAAIHGVGLVMARAGAKGVFLKGGVFLRQETGKPLLAQYDDPEILLAQLSRLNSFQNSGDVVVFGAFHDGKQINFEHQAGGHGSIGGEQAHPFVLAKREWGIDTSEVRGAHELHPILRRLRDRLRAVKRAA